MKPEERDRILARLLAAWPRPPMPDSQLLIWNEHFDKLDAGAAMAALHKLEMESRHRPSLADFHESYALQRRGHSDRALPPPVCGVCDNGWVEVEPGTIPTVTRCPNGCMPMNSEQRQAHNEMVAREYDRARGRGRARAGVGSRPLDFTEPGSRHDPDERF